MIDAISPEEFRKKERARIPDEVYRKAEAIVNEVRSKGLDALREYSLKFDGFDLDEENIRVGREDIKAAAQKLGERQRATIDEAYNRVYFVQKAVAASQREVKLSIEGGLVSLKLRPIERVGVYVPGGVAPLPSSLLMAGVTARAAGVKELVLCTPPQVPVSPAILYVAGKLGIKEIYRIGGAQAIAARETTSARPMRRALGKPSFRKRDHGFPVLFANCLVPVEVFYRQFQAPG